MPPSKLPAPNKNAAPLDGMPETYFLLKFVESFFSRSSLQKIFHAPHINIGKVCHRPSRLNQFHAILDCPTHHAQ
jgi:hypothetical protein